MFYIISFGLFLSVVINIIFLWYARNLIKLVAFTNEDNREIYIALSDYQDHLENVYSMDLFYGDSTLESLLKHTKQITEEINIFVSETDQIIMEEPND